MGIQTVAALIAMVAAGACYAPVELDTSDTQIGGTPDVLNEVAETVDASVKSAQAVAESVTCDPQGFIEVDPAIVLADVVVMTPKFDASPMSQPNTIDGYFVVDRDGGVSSAILLRVPVALAPASALAMGDVIDVTGQLTEVFCWTQIEASRVTRKGTAPLPEPIVLASPDDIGDEAYESMLVRIEAAQVVAASAQGGLMVTPGDIGIGIIDWVDGGSIDISAGNTYDITGVVRINFGAAQIVPRGPTDVTRQ